MAIRSETIDIPVYGETCRGYFAAPEGGPFPGVVVIQEIFGVNEHIRAVTERLAGEGYACLAPDLFWRLQPGFTSGYSAEEIAQAREMKGRVDTDRAVEDVYAAMTALRGRPESRGDRIGVTGFCWGGLMTYLAACRLDPTCASSFYGGGIAGYLDEMNNLLCPTQFHFGEQDQSIPMEQVEQVRAAAGRHHRTNVEIFTYPEAGHGFHCDLRADYHEPSARQAWERTLRLFRAHLQT